jgi:hypothetical protein
MGRSRPPPLATVGIHRAGPPDIRSAQFLARAAIPRIRGSCLSRERHESRRRVSTRRLVASCPGLGDFGGGVDFQGRALDGLHRLPGGAWRSRIDGAERRQLTFPDASVSPRWSPDGGSIAFVDIEEPWTIA